MSTILFDLHEGIARITLNRPERLNSIDTAMRGELMQVLRDRRLQAARALILTGTGRAFCTGQDLAERVTPPGAPPPDLGESIETFYKPLVLGLRARPDQYQSRHLRVSFGRVQRIREQLIHGVACAYNPDLFVVDNVPRGVEGELLPTFRYLRRRRPNTRIVLTLRDVLDDPANILPLWRKVGMLGVLDEYYDEIWIAGCRAVFDPTALYELPARIARKVKFCGYVVRGVPRQTSVDVARELRLGKGPYVTVSCGGGGDGYAVVDAYVDAGKRLAADGVESFVFLGSDMPSSQRRRLKERLLPLSERIHTFDYRPDLVAFLELSAASLSMAGYNTVCERHPAM